MLRILEYGRCPANATVDANQLNRVQGLAADLALVAAGAGVGAVRAGAFHVPVGQETLAFGAVGLGDGLLVDVAFLQQGEENIVSYLSVVGGAGGGEQIPGDAQLAP